MAKVIAFNGSPKKSGNTSLMIDTMFKVFEENGFETEKFQIGGKLVRGCTGCGKCREIKNKECIFKDDFINEAVAKMDEADIIIIGSPSYFATLTTEAKALIDRTGYVTRGNGMMLSKKIGIAVSAQRRAGAMNVIQTINNFFYISDMVVPGSSYWNLGFGKAPGDVASDTEALNTITKLAENAVWLYKKIVN